MIEICFKNLSKATNDDWQTIYNSGLQNLLSNLYKVLQKRTKRLVTFLDSIRFNDIFMHKKQIWRDFYCAINVNGDVLDYLYGKILEIEDNEEISKLLQDD